MTTAAPQADRTRATLPGSSSGRLYQPEVPDGTPEGDAALVLAELGIGKANARKQEIIGRACGFDGAVETVRRRVQTAIDVLRKKHKVPVGSSMEEPYGSFICETEQEVTEFLRPQINRIVSTFELVNAMDDAAAFRLVGRLRGLANGSGAASGVGRPLEGSLEPGTAAVYVLCHPETGAARYVGLSREPSERLKAHNRYYSGVPLVSEWVGELKAEGLSPELRILETCEDRPGIAPACETKWIKRLSGQGADLLNKDGTDGPRLCKCGCGETFEPAVHNQRFVGLDHKRKYESRVYRAGTATAGRLFE